MKFLEFEVNTKTKKNIVYTFLFFIQFTFKPYKFKTKLLFIE